MPGPSSKDNPMSRKSQPPTSQVEAKYGAHSFLNIDRKWWVLIAVGTGTFMSALDISAINTVLPIINREFNSSIATIEWVVIVYLLLVSGLLPIFGRLGDIRGHKPVYITGFLIFITSSVFCGLSPSVYALIAARGLQALGAAMLSANSPAILTKSFPSSQRGQALGMQATMTYLGLTVGPALGGWLTDLYNWRAVFFINVPVGLLALFLSLRFIQRDTPEKITERFDWPGALTLMGGLITLLVALNQGHNWGWLSPITLALLTISIFLLGIFIAIEKRTLAPMLDLTLFRNRLFSTSISSAVINYICVYSILFLMPFYLIQGRELSPSQAGLILTAQPIIMAIVAPISGTLSDRIGTRIPSIVGMVSLAVGLFSLSQIGPYTPLNFVAIGLAIAGLGIGVFISPNNSALMGSAPHSRQGIAAGLLATSRNVGMVLGVGLSGAIFTSALTHSAGVSNQALFQAIQISFLVAAGLATIGIITSAIR